MKGLGVHTGEHQEVHLYTLAGKGDVHLKVPGASKYLKWYDQGVFTSTWDFDLEAQNSTLLRFQGIQLQTIEHFLAALVFFYPSLKKSNRDLYIRVEGVEFPIADGSAWPWFQELSLALPLKPQEVLDDFVNSYFKVHRYTQEKGYRPKQEIVPQTVESNLGPFQLQYQMNFSANSIQTQEKTNPNFLGQTRPNLPTLNWSLNTETLRQNGVAKDNQTTHAIKLIEETLKARTFIRAKDYSSLKAKGLLQGARPESGWAYFNCANSLKTLTWGFQNQTDLEPTGGFQREFLLHKCVDFIGDLAILSLKLPSGSHSLVNAGHKCHHLILKGLINEYSR